MNQLNQPTNHQSNPDFNQPSYSFWGEPHKNNEHPNPVLMVGFNNGDSNTIGLLQFL